MAVYFGTPLKRVGYGKVGTGVMARLSLNGTDVLSVSDDVEGETFHGWRRDLSIDPLTSPYPTLIKAQSDEAYLLLAKRHHSGFASDRVMVPCNQFVKCWNYWQHVKAGEGNYRDLMLVMASPYDMFCIVSPHEYMIHVVLNGDIMVDKVKHANQLLYAVENLRVFQERGQTFFLQKGHFNKQYWREVLPQQY